MREVVALETSCTAHAALPHSPTDAEVRAAMQLKTNDRAKLACAQLLEWL
jgi:hypothetical protein